MSLTKLQTFIRKISRFLYYTQDFIQAQPNMSGQKNDQNESTMQKNVGQIIPLCIDYVLEKEFCDEASLASLLQLDEKLIKKSLEKLKNHGILKDEEIYKEYYQTLKDKSEGYFRAQNRNGQNDIIQNQNDQNFQQNQQINNTDKRSKIRIYFFNIDLMYVLKARLYILDKQLNKKFDEKQKNDNKYICSNYKKGKCQFRKEVLENEYFKKNNCPECGLLLEEVKTALSKEVQEGCKTILDELKKNLKELSEYRIPPPFFGPIAAAQASKSFPDDYFQQYDEECMNYTVIINQNLNGQFNPQTQRGGGIFARELPIKKIFTEINQQKQSQRNQQIQAGQQQGHIQKLEIEQLKNYDQEWFQNMKKKVPEIVEFYVEKSQQVSSSKQSGACSIKNKFIQEQEDHHTYFNKKRQKI